MSTKTTSVVVRRPAVTVRSIRSLKEAEGGRWKHRIKRRDTVRVTGSSLVANMSSLLVRLESRVKNKIFSGVPFVR